MSLRSQKNLKHAFLVIAVCFCLLPLLTGKAHANVYLDSSNNFCIQTEDQIKTSSIWYRTVGFTISRCKYNPATKELHDTGESVYFRIDESQTVTQNRGGVQSNIFKVPLSAVIAQASAEWAKEIQNALDGGPAVYLRFDSVMVIYHGSTLVSGPYANYPAIDGRNPAAIKAAEAWRNPKGLDSHYNRYFIIGSQQGDVTEEIGDEDNVKISSEKSKVVYKTGNSSPDGYTLDEGIPSGKDVTNEYIASKWYGETEVYARTVTTDQYESIGYQYTYRLKEEKDVPDPDNPGQTKTETTYTDYVYSGTFHSPGYDWIDDSSVGLKAEVAFEYLAHANFYDLQTTGVYNLAYDGTIYYDSEYDVPMKAVTTNKFVDIADEANGADAIETWYADTDKHVTWAKVDTSTRTNSGSNTYTSVDAIKAAAKAQFKKDKDALLSDIKSGTTSTNDHLEVDGTVYLTGGDENKVTGCDFLNRGVDKLAWSSCVSSSAVVNKYVVGSISNASVAEESGSTTVNIPYDTDNGKYPTGIEVIYARKIKNDSYSKIFRAGAEWFSSYSDDSYDGPLSPDHCLDSYEGIIFVHTPIISPFTLTDDQGEPAVEKTQTVASIVNDNAQFQLLLDSGYIIDWEQATHRNISGYGDSEVSSGGETYSKYDEFVEAKYVKFPFDVVYAGKFYDKDTWIQVQEPESWETAADLQTASESNDWQPQSNNHWRKMPFYIPSYAEECGQLGDDVSIKCLVEAYNVDGRYGGDHNEEDTWIYKEGGATPDEWENAWETEANREAHTDDAAPAGARYATMYEIPIQLSGIIYDFMITGSNDWETFHYKDVGSRVMYDEVPFCMYKQEKRSKLNRLGETTVRYRIDGDINRNWPQQDTLPLMAGTSHSFSDMGYIMKGSTFAYSFKTIANLGDENDSIIITPTFRYVREDGTVADWEDIKLYYHSPEDNELYVEYGSTRDTEERNATYVQLSGKMFQNSYYEDEDPNPKQFGRWLTYSAGKESISTQEYLYRDSSYYCMSKIKLPYTARMLSGEWEQLKWNTRGRGKEDNAIIRYSDLTYDTYNGYIDGVPNYTRGQSNWTSSMTEEFRDSMQTWFGEFHIPADLFVVDLKKHNLPSDFDLMEYMTQKGGIQEDDEIFDTDQGYLIINFDIKTKNGGKAHLQYDGTGGGKTGGNDMWATEGNPTTVQVQQHKVDGTVYTIPLESGDVGIIDMTLSINNRYGAAIFNIN